MAVPLTAAAAGGLIGAALWFTRPPSKANQHPGVVRALLVCFAAAVLAVYAALGLVDVAHFPQVLQLVLSSGGGCGGAVCCCGSACTWRCCTRRTTRSSPTSRCCARTAVMSFPTWRSARRAGSRRARRRARRARRDVTRARCAARRSPTGHERATTRRSSPAMPSRRVPTPPRRCATPAIPRVADLGRRYRRGGRWRWSGVDGDQQAAGALRVPARLRAAADGNAGRDQSPVHRAGRRLLRLVSRPRGPAYKITTKPNGVTADFLGRRRRHDAVVQ